MLYKLFSTLVIVGTLASGVPAYGGENEFKSEWIGVVSCQKIKTGSDSKTKVAEFWNVCTLQGPPGEVIPVHIQETTELPAINSKWIIFIPNCVPQRGAFHTIKGQTGQLPYNFSNLKSTIEGIEKQNPGQTRSPEQQKSIDKLIESWKPGMGGIHWPETSVK